MIFSAMAGSTNLPNNFSGANAVTVIQMNLGNDSYDSMIAFTFAVDKIAIRRKTERRIGVSGSTLIQRKYFQI